MTVDYNFNPNSSFGGTWTKITTDAYLKIVSDNNLGGVAGGTSSEHKIPIASMPSHNHSLACRWSGSTGSSGTLGQMDGGGYSGAGIGTNSTGGGEAYYPYYIGVYVWKRTA